jgi:hypothetical protein
MKKVPQRKTVIGIVGTAKNTGKTTTLNCLLKEAARRNISVGITGIGYDGEEADTVTLLPKPRINVQPDSIVATSERCLDISTAPVEILHRTGLCTSLGEILITRVLRAGLLVIAGPGKKEELRIILEKLKQYEAGCIFVDGSLNRIAPMSAADSVIFTTGGSRSTDIALLSSEMHAIESLFILPLAPAGILSATESVDVPLLLEAGDVDDLLPVIGHGLKTLFISKYISPAALVRLSDYYTNGPVSIQNIILPDPFVLLMNENIVHTHKSILKLQKHSITVSYRCLPKLAYITANPFFPEYTGNTYSPQFLNGTELLMQLRRSCSTPVFNTQETEPSLLFNACF